MRSLTSIPLEIALPMIKIRPIVCLAKMKLHPQELGTEAEKKRPAKQPSLGEGAAEDNTDDGRASITHTHGMPGGRDTGSKGVVCLQ
ncbi:hypothetical protein PoB_004008500 [Plakobranchus ocellatus]|uniref:Uncharacterized protein n=1 Tax=Plakobranchus ocellatus TaxID=259542 RepID=A0AAV4B1W3_9GAST|nr:hypothetical protein PoB_004008500 [Plakobranchus ocellatus]